jgi:putative hydrolase of the HAD superfamily
LVIAK